MEGISGFDFSFFFSFGEFRFRVRILLLLCSSGIVGFRRWKDDYGDG